MLSLRELIYRIVAEKIPCKICQHKIILEWNLIVVWIKLLGQYKLGLGLVLATLLQIVSSLTQFEGPVVPPEPLWRTLGHNQLEVKYGHDQDQDMPRNKLLIV